MWLYDVAPLPTPIDGAPSKRSSLYDFSVTLPEKRLPEP